MIGIVGQLAPVALDDLACQGAISGDDARPLRHRNLAGDVTLVTEDDVASGTARTFFTHSASPRVDTRYFTPSTSGTTTGIFCGCLLRRLVTVSVWLPPMPVAIAILLNIVRVNHGGLTYAMP